MGKVDFLSNFEISTRLGCILLLLLLLLLEFIAGESSIPQHKNTHKKTITKTHNPMRKNNHTALGNSWFFTKPWNVPSSSHVPYI